MHGGGGEPDEVPPWIVGPDGSAIVADSEARMGETCCHSLRLGAVWNKDIDAAQSKTRRTKTCSPTPPRIHGHVMVIPTGRHKKRRVPHARGRLKSQCLDVEPVRSPYITHLEMHMPEGDVVSALARLLRYTGHVLGNEAMWVNVLGGHVDLVVSPLPVIARTVDVEFYPVALRVVEIERLRDMVITRTGEKLRSMTCDSDNRGGKLARVLEEDRRVKQPGRSLGTKRKQPVLPQNDDGEFAHKWGTRGADSAFWRGSWKGGRRGG